jgi:hypothetical protein
MNTARATITAEIELASGKDCNYNGIVFRDAVEADSIAGYGTAVLDAQNSGNILSVLWTGGSVGTISAAANDRGAITQSYARGRLAHRRGANGRRRLRHQPRRRQCHRAIRHAVGKCRASLCRFQRRRQRDVISRSAQ